MVNKLPAMFPWSISTKSHLLAKNSWGSPINGNSREHRVVIGGDTREGNTHSVSLVVSEIEKDDISRVTCQSVITIPVIDLIRLAVNVIDTYGEEPNYAKLIDDLRKSGTTKGF